MEFMRASILRCLVIILGAGCGPIPSSITINLDDNNPDVNAVVAATFQAMTAQASGQPTNPAIATSVAPPAASISGTLNYPAESLPAMHVTAFQVGTSNYKYITTVEGEQTYQIDDLPPGTYHIVAYTVGSQSFPAGLAGGYTQAVPCGLNENCSDHGLIDVAVGAGQAVTGINPADWYLVQGAFPPFPGQGSPEATPVTAVGSIKGTLMYPASGIPALRIVAFSTNSNAYYDVDTTQGAFSYELTNLPPGTYHVVAYVIPGGGFNAGPAGGYSQMVPCGLQYGCTDHTLIDVVVTAGNTTSGVDPNDYYADPGTFPANPVP